MRIIIYTGKGGVGKTSVAACTAARCAKLGHCTLVVSTDPAHSLSDSFNKSVKEKPTRIGRNLWAQEISSLVELEENWKIIQSYIEDLFAWGGVEEILIEELLAFPGLDELFSLIEIKEAYDRKEYDVIIVDCAPTGETLRLLSFPDIAKWWLERLFPLQRKATAVAKPLVTAITGLPLPDRRIYDSVEEFSEKLVGLKELFSDPGRCSIRMVMNPEKMIIKESQRTYTYLALFGYVTDAVVLNRVIPKGTGDSYFEDWAKIHNKYRKQIRNSFSPLPVLEAPLFRNEVIGVKMLEQLADKLFGEDDPSKLFFEGKGIELTESAGGYIMTIPLPLASKESIELHQKDGELVVKIGQQKRDIMLPRGLKGMKTTSAKLEEGVLKLYFERN